MAHNYNIHFKLRAQGKTTPIIILNVFDSRFPHRKFMYSTGKSIRTKEWNSQKERPKVHDELFEYLNSLEKRTVAFLDARLDSSTLNREDLKKHLESSQRDERKERESQLQKEDDFFRTWQHIIDSTKGKNGESIASGTKRSKEQTKNLVSEYAVAKKAKLTWENLDMKFYQALDIFMTGKDLSPNSRGKHFKELKAIMREAFDRDIPVNQSYLKKSFKVVKVSTDSVYLTEEELKKMLALNLSPAKAALRDIFVAAAFVGVRHSDWYQIRKENIVIQNKVELLKITQTKTKETIHVPVHPVVRTILNKYETTPRVISNQKFNEAIKEICEHEDLKLGKAIVNGKEVDKSGQVSTHTARRSFATNAYLRGMDTHQIMRCTGHKTESSFLKYLKLQGRDYAELAAESEFFNDQSWNMAVAV